MAQRQVRPPDVGPDLREQRSEVVAAATTEHQRPLKDRGMDQQVPARLDHQPDHTAPARTVPPGRRRAGVGLAGRGAARAPERGPRARSDGQRQHGGNHDRAA